LKNSGIKKPVLIDVVSGDITPIEFKKGSTDTLESLPLRDSVMAIADADYFDWPVLPEAPSGLTVNPWHTDMNGRELRWESHSPDAKFVIERREDHYGWVRVGQPISDPRYLDTQMVNSLVCYRIRAANSAGQSAFSNIACVGR
jgi:hypothetical protein